MAEMIIALSGWQIGLTVVICLAFLLVELRLAGWPGQAGRWTRWGANALLFGTGVGALVALASASTTVTSWIGGARMVTPLVDLGLPAPLLVVASFLIIDFLMYLLHLGSHMVPLLWRLHRTHHSDVVLDASTGVRHHPLETVFSNVVMLALFALLGLPLLVILAYGLISLVWQFVTHADVRLPEALDRPLRTVLVTPGMHRIHHSTNMAEGNSNFGQVLSIWDRLFGTYRSRQEREREALTMGVAGFDAGGGLTGPLGEPFRR